jgi:uracil phosphoribosyltransferase
MINNLGKQNSILNQYLAEVRDYEIQTDRLRFRTNLERIAQYIGFEISRRLEFESSEVQTPLGIIEVPQLADEVVIASILRAGIPMHDAMLRIFDHAENAFIAAYRKYRKDDGFEIKLEYITCPNLDGKVLIICDPMIATGVSMEQTYRNLMAYGTPKHTHIASVISSFEGVSYLEKKFNAEEMTIWTGAIDDEMTVKSYIVPGLGDAGDLAFGPKED